MHESEVEESNRELSEAERDFCVAEAELFGRPLDRGSIAATTALVFGKLLDYLAAGRAYQHAETSFIEEAIPDKERGTARVMVENLHRTIDRASVVEEEFRLEKITFHVLLMVKRADRETTA